MLKIYVHCDQRDMSVFGTLPLPQRHKSFVFTLHCLQLYKAEQNTQKSS